MLAVFSSGVPPEERLTISPRGIHSTSHAIADGLQILLDLLLQTVGFLEAIWAISPVRRVHLLLEWLIVFFHFGDTDVTAWSQDVSCALISSVVAMAEKPFSVSRVPSRNASNAVDTLAMSSSVNSRSLRDTMVPISRASMNNVLPDCFLFLVMIHRLTGMPVL